ncbi:hypothetical protein LUZ63_016633 [Rhynchospora breviuscula]|uniref:VQ domain-containing protein n=1 Tax=Rhynchospora breviuscula TaxID=2022672 RepID=A0A9P9ZAW2_9POAL|nr:hypothetical protein LUZ63_016633 [Rhynchospora breviuscula]
MDTREQMKVKFIVTKVIEADAAHFKSVAQNLTGKDSTWLKGSEMSTDHADCQRRRQSMEVKNVVQYGGYVPSMEELFEFLRD